MPYRNKRWRGNLNRTFPRTDGRRNHKDENALNCLGLVTRNKSKRSLDELLRNSNPMTTSWLKRITNFFSKLISELWKS